MKKKTIIISERDKHTHRPKKREKNECQLLCTYNWIFCTMATQICVQHWIKSNWNRIVYVILLKIHYHIAWW